MKETFAKSASDQPNVLYRSSIFFTPEGKTPSSLTAICLKNIKIESQWPLVCCVVVFMSMNYCIFPCIYLPLAGSNCFA